MSETRIDPALTIVGYQEIHRDLLPGVPIGTLRALQQRGELPHSVVIGRRRCWRRSDIEAWIENVMSDGGA